MSSSSAIFCHLPPAGPLHRRQFAGPRLPRPERSAAARQATAFGREYRGGRRVDESMIVLRKRIHEMKMAETNYEAPREWTEWEKRYYASYHSDVCELLCLLQTVLLRTRPGLAIGFAVALGLSVPTSAAFIIFHLVEASKAVIVGAMHLA